MISVHEDLKTAVKAMRMGAYDYIEKPPDLNNLLNSVRSALVKTKTKKIIHTFAGSCMVHERFTEDDITQFRERYPGVVVLAHPECPQDVLQAADHAGSTQQMIDYIVKHPCVVLALCYSLW